MDLSSTRLCWYSDTEDDNFNVGYISDKLFLASGDSGHAFSTPVHCSSDLTYWSTEFLPVIGDLIAAAIDRQLPEELTKLWAPDRPKIATSETKGRHLKTPKTLAEVGLASAADLKWLGGK